MIHIIIDLEMNPIKREMQQIREFLTDEVIEIGAVKLDENYQTLDTFQEYVHPVFRQQISRHITDLTGITDATVAGKEEFPAVFKRFFDWIGTWDFKLYSWSSSDILQLKNECSYKIPEFDVDRLESQWFDLQKEFDNRIGITNQLALKDAIGAMNKNFKGTQHTALADAENTAKILVLMQDDEKFNQVMQPVIEMLKPKELSESIGELYPELMNFKFD